jgi:hypothetical protein
MDQSIQQQINDIAKLVFLEIQRFRFDGLGAASKLNYKPP